jgi:hypothetical protein
MYSIYKMLPNDTDLTVLENKKQTSATTKTITTTYRPR